MSRCPMCFHVLSPDLYAWICTSQECEAAHDEVASEVRGRDTALRRVMTLDRQSLELTVRQAASTSGQAESTSRQVKSTEGLRWPLEGAGCDKCQRRTTTQVCPNCHFGPLPSDWRDSNTTCVAMAGARTTGKTFYVAIAVRQLERLAMLLGRPFDAANESTALSYREIYEKPLFEERGILQATRTVLSADSPNEPLIFGMGMLNGQRQYVVLRDVAGEDLGDRVAEGTAGVDMSYLGFMGHADGVLFLFDPLRVRAISDQLQGVIPPQRVVGGDPQLVLNNILRIIDRKSPRVAVVVSKFDTMQSLREVKGTVWSQIMSNSGSAIMRDPSLLSPAYDQRDGGLLDAEVRSLLRSLGAEALVLSMENPNNGHALTHKFFAMSVLGEAPVGDRLHSRGIAPFRCLDPLKWILAENGAIPTIS